MLQNLIKETVVIVRRETVVVVKKRVMRRRMKKRVIGRMMKKRLMRRRMKRMRLLMMKIMKKKKKKCLKKEEEEEDVNMKRNKRSRKGNGEVVMSKVKKIKVEDKEVGEKKRKKDSEPSSSEDEKPLKKKTKGKGKGPNAKVNMKSFMKNIGFSALHSVNIDTLPNRLARFVVRAFNSKTYNFYLKTRVIHVTAEKFAPKKKKQIFATDIAEKLVCSTRVDFMFKVNFLMLFVNVMGKADTMRAFINLSVVRCIREDTNIAGLDWCDFIHRCLAISHKPNTIICEMIEEKLSRISKEKAEVETLL
nr:hypothetical protein [Tanacetum cinerariifolium]